MKLIVAITVFDFLALHGQAVLSQHAAYPFVQQYAAAFDQALRQGNTSLLSPYYAAQMRLMPPFQKTMKGRSAVTGYYKALSDRFIILKTDFKSRHAYTIDTLLVDLGTFEMSAQQKSGGSATHKLEGNFLHLWSIRDPGKPRLLTDAWNVKNLPFDQEQFRFHELPTTNVALAAHLPVNNDCSFELAALNRMMEATVTQHDAVSWTLFYADDAVLLAGGDYYAGKEAIGKYLVAHVVGFPVFEKLDIRNDEINDLQNGYVIEYASHIANWRYDEHSGIGLGKDFRIWKRQPNGRLKMVAHIGSYD